MSWFSEALISLLVSIRLYWLHLNQSIFRFLQKPLFFTPRKTEMDHSVVAIGDGFIEGFGDWVILFGNAGICEKIPKILSQKRAVRQRWTFFNRGHYGSTSFDWNPQTTRKPNYFSFGVNKSLFYDTFDDPNADRRVREAEIVLLCVGSMDHLNAGADGQLPSKTFENIKEIVEELTKRGKTVVVSMIPLGINGQKRVALDERNKLLQKYHRKQSNSFKKCLNLWRPNASQ
eukprot:TRINITY_DN3408_c0_g1_i3.p1 TRINITY_DN3408_c0_g1~~TRINITY_DN3408_c0_g1_i3.p1  ORF type:complete len:231 (+),score=49.36 TRINITY_DN3408_c0_g1_i3:123-815(+)